MTLDCVDQVPLGGHGVTRRIHLLVWVRLTFLDLDFSRPRGRGGFGWYTDSLGRLVVSGSLSPCVCTTRADSHRRQLAPSYRLISSRACVPRYAAHPAISPTSIITVVTTLALPIALDASFVSVHLPGLTSRLDTFVSLSCWLVSLAERSWSLCNSPGMTALSPGSCPYLSAPFVRLTAVRRLTASFRGGVVRLGWGPVKDGEGIHLVRLRPPWKCTGGSL